MLPIATKRGRLHRFRCPLLGLVVLLLVGACAATPPPTSPLVLFDKLPAGADKGYLEIYCTDCLSNFSIFQLDNGKETLITTFMIGKTVAGATQSTERLKRLRIAQPPGGAEYVAAATSPAFKGLPQRFTASTAKDHITPIRMEFIRHTNVSLDWKAVVGPPLPLTTASTFIESLTSALSAPDWGTRWYAVEALIMSGEQIPGDSPLAQRLTELSSEDGYKACVEHEDVFDCALVRDEATRGLKAIAAQSP